MILDFIQGAALLLALCWLQTINRRLWTDHCVMAPLLSGLLFGTTCVVGMLTPIVLKQGLIFDARTAVLSMAGLFGGPLVAAVAALMAGGYRFWLGGSGVWVGLANVLMPVLLGLAYRYWHQRGKVQTGPWQLLAFGLLVHVLTVLLLTLLPAAQASLSLRQVAVPMLLVLPLATLILGLLLRDIEYRLHTERALAQSEARMGAITRAIPDLLLVLDEDGRYVDVVAPNPSCCSCRVANCWASTCTRLCPRARPSASMPLSSAPWPVIRRKFSSTRSIPRPVRRSLKAAPSASKACWRASARW